MHEFQFAAPDSLDAALTLLREKGAAARVMTGGTDLIVNMRVGRRKPELVIDGKRIPDLNQLSIDGSGLTIGGAVPCRVLWQNQQIRKEYPAVIDSAELIGGVAIQGRATLGGNLCNAAPSADGIPTLIVLGATAQIVGPNGTREVPVEEICLAPGKTSLADDELLVSIKIPAPVKGAGARFLRFIPRNEMDIAVVNAAACVVLDGDTFSAARIAVGAVAPTPLFVKEAGDALVGKPVSDDSIAAAAQIAMDAAKPISDMRGTVKQRKHLTKVLVTRALRGAVDRAKGA
ncbi:MAG: xanthine dehydrogenase family protein subunit M [Pseudomonadota bacterium]|nr:xanthine dehydrogenase family protein subunit M [Pseudomonadota bacterium]